MKFSNSEIRAYKRCRRKWWLTYYRKLRPVREGVGPLAIGNMIHHPLELYYSVPNRDAETFDWETPLAAYVNDRLQDPALPDHLHTEMLESFELSKIMLRGYFEWLASDGGDSEFRVVAAEEEIEAYIGEILGTEVWLMGKLDTVVELVSNGLRGFMDHKSVADMKTLPAQGEKDEQFKTYGLLQRLKAAADGVTNAQFATGGFWNMLKKVKRTAQAKPPFYLRAEVNHNETVYQTFYTRIWGEVSDLLTTRANLDAGVDHQQAAYPNPTRDCGWDCPFNLICAKFDDGSDVEFLLAQDFEVHDPYARYTEVEKG